MVSISKKNIVIILGTCLGIIVIGAVSLFLYQKKPIEKATKNELQITPRAIILQPLADLEASDQKDAAVLYGTIISISGSGDTLTVQEQATEVGVRATVFTVTIGQNTSIMQSIIDKTENMITISSAPRNGDSFVLRVGSYVEIAYRKPSVGNEIVADRIIYSD
ncbi:hypothetical protein HY623_04250 [Candidatus Uhrbacteria bacterium]|nr:hypothetical protein [Candidatus Uhrbacteria bacterium]